MFHAIELLAILLFVAVGEGVVQAAPRVTRRIAVSMAMWVLAFSASIALLSTRRLAAAAVPAGLLLLAAYVVRWIISDVVKFLRGPQLLEPPDAAELGELAQQVGGLPAPDCRRIARRLLREHDGAVALLGLISMSADPGTEKDAFESAWKEASEKARGQAVGIAEDRIATSRQGHATAADTLFVAQVLCLYERESVVRVMSRLPPAAKGRAGRVEAAAQLAEAGRERKESRRFGLVAQSRKSEESRAMTRPAIQPGDVFWPPMGLIRAGFKERAAALAITHGALATYGVAALLLLQRDSGWVFLGAAALIHVQALFAIGDFNALAVEGKENARAGNGSLP